MKKFILCITAIALLIGSEEVMAIDKVIKIHKGVSLDSILLKGRFNLDKKIEGFSGNLIATLHDPETGSYVDLEFGASGLLKSELLWLSQDVILTELKKKLLSVKVGTPKNKVLSLLNANPNGNTKVILNFFEFGAIKYEEATYSGMFSSVSVVFSDGVFIGWGVGTPNMSLIHPNVILQEDNHVTELKLIGNPVGSITSRGFAGLDLIEIK